MIIKKALSFDDVLLIPQKSAILPRETDISARLSRRILLDIPIVSSPMDTVTESRLAIALAQAGGLGFIHKNMDITSQAAEVKKVKAAGFKVGAAISVGSEQFDRALALATAGVDVLVVDTAHGHSLGVAKMVRDLKADSRLAAVDIIAGNIVTSEAADDLIKAGADGIKVGVGPGSICTTRIITGVGVPQITAIVEAVAGRRRSKRLEVPIIADGGIKYSGDIAKAIAAGADCVMIGSLLAGTDESPGKLEEKNGEKNKIYRGMGSLEAMECGSKDRYGQAGAPNKKLVPEGISGSVRYAGLLADVIFQLTGGLRSAMGYLGAKNITEMQKRAHFVEITPAGLKESHPHSLSKIDATVNYNSSS